MTDRPAPSLHPDRFRILDALSSGAGGDVWKARDLLLSRDVTVKRTAARHREFEALARLEHSNVPRVYDAITDGETALLVTEFIEGVTARQLLDGNQSGLPVSRAFELSSQLADALMHAHERGIVHGDIKAENVLIDAAGHAKLIDFGLAGQGAPETTEPTLSGTPETMAPEQRTGGPADERSDVYSLGVLLFEFFTGRSPFARSTQQGVQPQPIQHSIAELRHDVPGPLSDIVGQMLAEQPVDRPPLADVAVRLRERTVASRSSAGDSRSAQVCIGALTNRGDLEAWTRAAQSVCDAVEGCGGTVLFNTAFRLVFCVGYPSAHEHSSAEAIRILNDLRERRSATFAGAIDSGTVAITERRGIPMVLSPLVDTLVSTADSADGGEVLLGSGAATVLGSTVGLGAERVVGSVHGEFKGAALTARSSAPSQRHLLGRETELQALHRAWERAKRARGRAMLVVGEAGVGKSHLTREWTSRLAEEHVWSTRCELHEQHAPFSAFREFLLRAVLGVHEPTADAVEDALHARGVRERPWLDATREALFGASEGEPTPRDALLDRLAGMLLALSGTHPVAIVIEDAHWVDNASWGVFQRMSQRLDRRALLLLFVCRPEFGERWKGSIPSPLLVDRLPDEEAGRLVEAVAGERAVPARVSHDIVRYAKGIPLLLEQLTYSVTRAESAEGSGLEEVPTSLRESVQRRLAGLGNARRSLAALAMLGPGTPMELLTAASGNAPATVAAHFREGAERDLVEASASPTFRHALIRDAVYDSIPAAERTQWHVSIADLLESDFPQLLTERPDAFARHFVVAGKVERAIDLHEEAGLRARRKYAYEDACAHYSTARSLLAEHVAEGPDRDRRERDLLRGEYPAASAGSGWTDPHVRKLLDRSVALDATLGDQPDLGGLYGQYVFSLVSHNVEGLHGAFAAMDAAPDTVEVGFLRNFSHGVTHYHRGDLDAALPRLEQARATVLGSLDGRLAPAETLNFAATRSWSEDVLASPSLYLAVVASCRGQRELAETLQLEAEGVAERLGSPYASSFCFGVRTIHALILEDPTFATPTLAKLEELCSGDAEWLAFARAQLGMLRALRSAAAGENLAEAATGFGQSLGILRAMGFVVSSELQAAECADVCRLAGDYAAAHEHLDAALAIADHDLSSIYASRVHVVAARLAIDEGKSEDAAQSTQRARDALSRVKSQVPANTLISIVDALPSV